MTFLKRVLFWGVLIGIFYFVLSYHFIFFGGTSVRLLKKSKLTLQYTFYNTMGRTNEAILDRNALRKDGMADLLVEMGRMSEENRERILSRYEDEK